MNVEIWQLVLIGLVGAILTLIGFGLSVSTESSLGVGICTIGLGLCMFDIYLCGKPYNKNGSDIND